MPIAAVTDLELEYDTTGRASEPAILLISGLGGQLISWDEEFCEALASRGFYVIRYDNRDIGLSTDLSHLGEPDIAAIAAGRADPPYTLDDMAADAVGLLNELAIDRAHIVGASMGGYIAQLIAINHPDRVLTITSIMSALGGEDNVRSGIDPVAAPPPPPATAAEMEQQVVAVIRACSGPFFDEERVRVFAKRAAERSFRPLGRLRHAAAIAAAPSRADALRHTSAPFLVVHGELDPVLPIENGVKTAAAVAHSRFVKVPDMGHELPHQIWPMLIDEITKHAVGRGSTSEAQRS